MSNHSNEQEKRKYLRIPMQRNIRYRLCQEKFSNTIIEADASNISQNGILFKTKFPPPTGSIISIQVDVSKVKEFFENEKLSDVINVEKMLVKGNSIFGEVVRVVEDPLTNFSSVAVKLILNKDPNAEAKIENARNASHPQYIDPSIVPDEEKFDVSKKENKSQNHPQYIDPALGEEDDK